MRIKLIDEFLTEYDQPKALIQHYVEKRSALFARLQELDGKTTSAYVDRSR